MTLVETLNRARKLAGMSPLSEQQTIVLQEMDPQAARNANIKELDDKLGNLRAECKKIERTGGDLGSAVASNGAQAIRDAMSFYKSNSMDNKYAELFTKELPYALKYLVDGRGKLESSEANYIVSKVYEAMTSIEAHNRNNPIQ